MNRHPWNLTSPRREFANRTRERVRRPSTVRRATRSAVRLRNTSITPIPDFHRGHSGRRHRVGAAGGRYSRSMAYGGRKRFSRVVRNALAGLDYLYVGPPVHPSSWSRVKSSDCDGRSVSPCPSSRISRRYPRPDWCGADVGELAQRSRVHPDSVARILPQDRSRRARAALSFPRCLRRLFASGRPTVALPESQA